MPAKWTVHEIDANKALVVVFDICSSTNIVEDLTGQDKLSCLEDLIRDLKRHLMSETKRYKFFPYKFMGDGWILLFDHFIQGKDLLSFLKGLCTTYDRLYWTVVAPELKAHPDVAGLTFGLARGRLIEMRMFSQPEYVGRALNIASRLQGSVKDSAHTPAFRALVTKDVFRDYFSSEAVRFRSVTRQLRNIKGGRDYPCVKLFLHEGRKAAASTR